MALESNALPTALRGPVSGDETWLTFLSVTAKKTTKSGSVKMVKSLRSLEEIRLPAALRMLQFLTVRVLSPECQCQKVECVTGLIYKETVGFYAIQ